MTPKLTAPKIQEGRLEPETDLYLESRIEITDRLIEQAEFTGLDADRVSFDRVLFRQVTITESALREAEFTDAIFERCDFSNMNLADVFLNRVTFKDCKLIGTDFGGGRMQQVRFTDCIADYANY